MTRCRVFLFFESAVMSSLIPQSVPPVLSPSPRRAVSVILEPYTRVPNWCWLKGCFRPNNTPSAKVEAGEVKPRRLGTLMFGYEEHYPSPVPGCVVRVAGDPWGVKRWRVLLHEFTPEYFTVDDMGRVTNRRKRIHVSQVQSRHAVPVPVFSVAAVGQSLTC